MAAAQRRPRVRRCRLKALPTLRITARTTADSVLRKVEEIVLEDARRLDQNDWMHAVAAEGDELLPQEPTCGTVGCTAGWVTVLVDGEEARDGCGTAERARQILAGRSGLRAYLDELFLYFPDSTLAPGTTAYAVAVVGNIRQFRERHGAALRARRVKRAVRR